MQRKPRHEEHENHERWLVSYADFVTLLFAFFTVLYATSKQDQQKMEQVSASVKAALDGGMPHALLQVLSGPLSTLEAVGLDASTDPVALKRATEGSLSDAVVQVGLVDNVAEIALDDRVYFSRGSAAIHPAYYQALAQVATAVQGTSARVVAEGWADAVPTAGGTAWSDNWALAAARGTAVARHLVELGVPVSQVVASGRVSAQVDAERRAAVLRIQLDDRGDAEQVARALMR